MVFMGFNQQKLLVDLTSQHRSTMDSQSEWVFFPIPSCCCRWLQHHHFPWWTYDFKMVNHGQKPRVPLVKAKNYVAKINLLMTLITTSTFPGYSSIFSGHFTIFANKTQVSHPFKPCFNQGFRMFQLSGLLGVSCSRLATFLAKWGSSYLTIRGPAAVGLSL